MSHHSATHFLKHFLLSHSVEFGRDQNQVTSSYAKSSQLEQRVTMNEGSQGNHLCLSLFRKTNIILTIIISSQTEYNDSVNDLSGRTNLWSVSAHRWERRSWGHLNSYALMAAFLQYFILIVSANISIYKQYLYGELYLANTLWYSLWYVTGMPENIPMSQLGKVPLHGKGNRLRSLGYLMFDTSLKLKTVVWFKIVLSYAKRYQVSLGELARNT